MANVITSFYETEMTTKLMLKQLVIFAVIDIVYTTIYTCTCRVFGNHNTYEKHHLNGRDEPTENKSCPSLAIL